MSLCPTENELQGLLADRLPADMRPSVEGHIETCTVCQYLLDQMTRAGDLKLSPATATVTAVSRPAFLDRLQQEYPSTLLDEKPKPRGSLRFPRPATERAPLGQVGDFDVMAELGSGSFGWVFRAHDRRLNRTVALKVLKPEMTARSDVLMRFEREARKASLQHDHIVTVHHFENPGGFPPYLVMEYIEGETLEARIRREGKLTPEEAAAIARQAALGLAAAHEHGMVHRDIKPANILLDKTTGRAKISDFGLARDVVDESLAITATGEMGGTLPYMSPEHFRAPEQVDGRSDVFSLGVVLYELLTGELPFKGSFLQVRAAILSDEPVPPRRLRPSIPADLETITLACLEKDPDRRYATAQAVAEDLRRFQNGEPILCRPTGVIERTFKWVRRKPAQAALAGVTTVAALALVSLIVGLMVNVQLQNMNTELTTAKDAIAVVNGELQNAIGNLHGANKQLKHSNSQLTAQQAHVRRLNYIADMNLAHQAWQHDNFRLLNQLLTAQDDPKLRGFEWHYLRWLAKTDGRRIGPNDPLTAVAFDSTGRLLAFGVATRTGPQIQIWQSPSHDKPDGELLYTLRGQANIVTDLAFHPRNDWLIASDRQAFIQVWDYKENRELHTIPGVAPFAIRSGGDELAFLSQQGIVQRWSFTSQREVGNPLPIREWSDVDRADKTKRKVFGRGEGDDEKGGKPKIQNGGLEQLAFSPSLPGATGQRLAAVGGQYQSAGAVLVWDLKSGQRAKLDDAQHSDVVTSVAYSPDGNSLAAVGFDHALRVWDAKTGKLRFRRIAHQLEVLSVAFNPTGDRLVTAGWDQTVRIWNAQTGEEIRTLRGNRGIVRQVLFCPKTKAPGQEHLVSLNDAGELRWWDAAQDQSARVIQHREPIHALAFSREGQYLAALDRRSHVLIEDLTKPGVRYKASSFSPVTGILFSREDKSLLLLGNDGTLQPRPFGEEPRPVFPDVPDIQRDRAWFAGSRVVLQKAGQWWVSEPNPVTKGPWPHLVSFGKVPQQPPSVVAVDAAGERLAFAQNDGSVRVLSRSRLDETVTETTMANRSLAQINALAFSPDGEHLAAGTQDNSVVLWSTPSGKLLHELTGHLCYVSCVAFSPDGKRLVSGSEDWTIKMWDIEVGRATLTLSGHRGRIRGLAFSPDAHYLASASEDATVRLWPGIAE